VKFLFKTFNRNVSSLDASVNVKKLLHDLIITLDLHGSAIQQLSAPTSTQGGQLQEVEGAVIESMDEVELVLHQEIFGQDP
tara:strand:+ start:3289 stop:3531 length:243 start_codon:yes stop_codon:yes gene_type:complete